MIRFHNNETYQNYMTNLGIAWLAVANVGFAVSGWYCIFRTNSIVKRAQESYTKHKLTRTYPFSGMVMKTWYPTYIRCAGIFIWFWAALIDFFVLTHRLR